MLEELKISSDLTRTENDAVAYRSTGSCCLDLFAVCGALRGRGEGAIIKKFARAYAESPDTAMRILFYARDVREGLGERRFFRVALRYLADHRPSSVINNLSFIPKFGRYDDLLVLLGTKCQDEAVGYIREALSLDLAAAERGGEVSLLAKWLPSINTSSEETRAQGKLLCRLLGMRESEYRKTLAKLRKRIGIVEDSMRRRRYDFDYSKLPSGAIFKYRRAMRCKDGKRYMSYIHNVRAGRETMHTATLYPYDIVRSALLSESENEEELIALDTAWTCLPRHTNTGNAIAVIDGSLSMYESPDNTIAPITVAISLGIYFAERSRGHFANHFITFSKRPALVDIKGMDIYERVQYCASYCALANTDLESVFLLILNTALENSLPQSELPETMYIISDMEFDSSISYDETIFNYVKKLYEKSGYTLPQVVYWNVASRGDHYPVRMNELGAVLVSGASPTLFSQAMSNDLDPNLMMRRIIDSARYADIHA